MDLSWQGDRVVLEEGGYANHAGDWVDDTLSEREYIAYEVMAAKIEEPRRSYREERKEAVTLRLYVDCGTGIVVRDVETYEASLKA